MKTLRLVQRSHRTRAELTAMRTAENIFGITLPSVQDLNSSRARKRPDTDTFSFHGPQVVAHNFMAYLLII